MLSGRRICVVGAGIGGLASAIALRQHGAEVTILERAPALSEVGAGLQISHNGFVVLRALGLEDAARQSALRAEAIELHDYRRTGAVLSMDLLRDAADRQFLLFHRADLIGILRARAAALGVRVLLGCAVAGPAQARAVLRRDGGTGADLIVAADGVGSTLRSVLNGAAAPRFTGQTAWRATLRADGGAVPRVRVFMAPGRHLVTYPLRAGLLHNIVAVQERARWSPEGWSHADDPAHLRAAFADFGPEAQSLLSRVEAVSKWGLFGHPVAARWYGDDLALVGDAAHPTLPFLAQGANLALEDAWTLAEALAAHSDQGAALAAYQGLRHDRCKRVIAAARGNAWKYHLRNPLLRSAAHTGLRIIGRLRPQAMLRSFEWLYGHDVTAR